MRAVAALHTLRQHLQLRCLLARLRAVGNIGREMRLAGSQDAPVRLLVCKYRKVNVPSADHEGGSCPAHRQAALTTGMRAHRAET